MAYQTPDKVTPPDSRLYVRVYKHKHDNYLWYVLRQNGATFSTHLYNGCEIAPGRPAGLSEGHYDMTEAQALADFATLCARY